MVVYEGPSEINGAPIVGIITGIDVKSKNPKTGPMAQLWILDAETPPHEAVKTGADESVCGDCPARAKWCYVTTFQGPLSIWKAWKRGAYGEYEPDRLRGSALRLGAYGDPAAIPVGTIQELCGTVDRFTGYTHAWRYCDSQFRNYCMASVDSPGDQRQAALRGWRTFRVTTEAGERLGGEAVCPASDEAGYKLTCFECGACDGRNRPRVKSHIVIGAHGNRTGHLEKFNG